MKTNSQTFSFSRFVDCITRDFTLNGRSWLLKGLMMFGVTAILLLLATRPNGDNGFYDYNAIQEDGCFLIFRFCGSVFCALGASLFMENMTTNSQRLSTIMVPASALEKFMSRWMICVLGVTIAFLLCYALADMVRVSFWSYYYNDVPGLRYVGPFEIQKQAEHWYYLWGSFAACQSIFVLGSTVWPKNSFLKTFGALVAFAIVFTFLTGKIYTLSLPEGHYYLSGHARQCLEHLPDFVPACCVVFCYITAYFRMKESEIINRF